MQMSHSREKQQKTKQSSWKMFENHVNDKTSSFIEPLETDRFRLYSQERNFKY